MTDAERDSVRRRRADVLPDERPRAAAGRARVDVRRRSRGDSRLQRRRRGAAGVVFRPRRARRERRRADAVVRAVRRGSDRARRRDAALHAAFRERFCAGRRRSHAPRRRAHEADPAQHAAQSERRARRRGGDSRRSTPSRSGAASSSSSTRSITRSITARRRARSASTRARRVLGDFSKSFSLPGLRIGLHARARSQAGASELENAHGYFTTSTSMLGELLAEVAARNRETIWNRARGVSAPNLALLDEWAAATRGALEWLRPRGSMTAFPRLRGVARRAAVLRRGRRARRAARARRMLRRAGAFSDRLRARDAALREALGILSEVLSLAALPDEQPIGCMSRLPVPIYRQPGGCLYARPNRKDSGARGAGGARLARA